jgi:2-polyprenyl-3-methyl-5-hydroxy-6-metoxy-1,4-benzoquinol methylase
MKWNAENIDASYRETVTEFIDGDKLAARQGIPKFIEEYRRSKVKNRITPIILDIASRPKSRILDAGCGHGWYPLSLASEKNFLANLTCIDISTHNIQLLTTETLKRGLSEKISAKIANCEKLPFNNDFFDLVYATESIEHM